MEKVWLCGAKENENGCLAFDGLEFSSSRTGYGHTEGAMVEFRGSGISVDIKSPVIIGGCFLQCRYSSASVEKWYDDFGGFWQELASVPTRSGELQGHSALSTENAIYVFGDLNYAKSYAYDIDSDTWESGPDLLTVRYGHRSIKIGESIFHVGGRGDFHIERWIEKTADNSEVILPNFAYYPELHVFSYDTIKQCM